MKREELIQTTATKLLSKYTKEGIIKVLSDFAESLTPAVKESLTVDPMTAEAWFDNNFDCYAFDEVLEEQFPAMTKEVFLEYASKPTVAEREVSDIRKQFLDEFGHEPTSNSNRRWEGVQWYMELTKERNK